MLFQGEEATIWFILGLIIATIVIGLVIYIAVILVESKTKARDKVIMIFLLAFIIVLVLPIILNVVDLVLSLIGDPLAAIRNAGPNYLLNLVPIIGFLLMLILVKFMIDIRWETAVWVSLITLFILYIIFTLVPELYGFIWGLF